ncbi:MAG: glycosyltransferase family 2 protein [Nitrospirae bacterium]|nr:glycosyltransferase family 2 protein [Nitrospirota bacterium]
MLGSRHPTHVIVVDNNSTDGTPKTIAEKFPQVELLAQPVNTGFGGGNNIGFARALELGARYVFVLNVDTQVPADTIGTLIRLASSNDDYGIISPIHLNYESTRIDTLFGFFLHRAGLADFFSDLYLGRARDLYPISFTPAAAWLMTRTALEKVGGFDPLFHPIYGEDDDLCNRIIHHGFKIGITPRATIGHWHGSHSSETPATHMSFRRSYRSCYGEWVAHLKKPGGSFFLHYLSLLRVCMTEFVSAVLYLNPRKFAVSALTLGVVSLRMGRIFHHRKKCMTEPGVWLDGLGVKS